MSLAVLLARRSLSKVARLSVVKITTILGLIILGIVISAGGGPTHEAIGFRVRKLVARALAGLARWINMLKASLVVLEQPWTFPARERYPRSVGTLLELLDWCVEIGRAHV